MGPHITPGKVYGCSEFLIIVSKKTSIKQKKYFLSANYIIFVIFYARSWCSTIKPQLKVEIGESLACLIKDFLATGKKLSILELENIEKI